MMKRKAPTPTAAPAAMAAAPAVATPADPETVAGMSEAPGAPVAKKKRTSQPMGNLTNAQKRRLCVKFAQVKMTQQELCQWAKKEFSLANLPHQSTISKILARSGELTSMSPRDLAARRKGMVTHPELDTALCNWVLCARQRGLKISGDIIKTQARALAAQMGVASNMTFSNGWLGGFKKRHNIRLGSAAAVDVASSSAADNSPAAMEAARAQLQQIARMYEPRDVFCVGETGLFYELPPEKPAGASGRGRATAAARREHCGPRLTLTLCVNADASERLEPMFIGPAKLPSGAQLREELDADAGNFYYQNNQRAWMTPVLFQDWVAALDTKMRDENRVVLLLVSPAPSHITVGLELTNVRLEMLPSSPATATSVTSVEDVGVEDSSAALPDSSLTAAGAPAVDSLEKSTQETPAETAEPTVPSGTAGSASATIPTLQPLDAGIVAAFKRRYRRYHMFHALDRYEAGLQDVFHVGQLQAMRWTRYCWKALPETVLRHCWGATELLGSSPTSFEAAAMATVEEGIEQEICDTVSALDVVRPLLIDEFVSPRDEDVGIHCAGTNDSDFAFTVPDYSSEDVKTTGKKSAGTKITHQQQVVKAAALGPSQQQPTSGAVGLTPRLQELHARNDAAVSAAAMEESPAMPLANVEAAAVSRTEVAASNEQLLECFKVLLPELDRLRFDDHTKKSIRSTFRRLKQTAEQQALDRKRGTVKKALPPPHFPPHLQPPARPQDQQQQQKQQQQLLQQQQQQLLLHQAQQQQLAQHEQVTIPMTATPANITEDTVL